MWRRCVLRRSLTLRDLSERLDSFEKEMIELKAFRKAVEVSAPSVAQAALRSLTPARPCVAVDAEVLANPLTPNEFVELTRFYALQRTKDLVFGDVLAYRARDDLLRHACAVHRDCLVRIALRVAELREAPYGLSQMPAMQELMRWYQWSFHDLRSVHPPRDDAELVTFDHCIRRIFLRHYNVSALLCKGMLELAEREQWGDMDAATRAAYGELEEFVHAFCVGRAKLRIIVSNYMALSSSLVDVDWPSVATYDPRGMTRPTFFGLDAAHFVGMLCTRCALPTLVRWTIDDVLRDFRGDGDAEGNDIADMPVELSVVGDEDLTFVGVPRVISDVVAALLIDALTATRQRAAAAVAASPRPVRVTLVQRRGCTHYSLCVSDTAGGVPLGATSQLLSCWSAYASRAQWARSLDKVHTWTRSPLRLPYAHCSARVIGGEVRIAAIESYGTDRYLYLPATGVATIAI